MDGFPFEPVLPPAEVGIDAGRLDKVVERFRRQCAGGVFPGGQLVLRRWGKLVLNEAFGLARGYRLDEDEQAVPVQVDTPFPLFSAGKPLAAVVIAMLEDKGKLDINKPIVELFPEFGRHGKEAITTLDVLTQRAGLLMPQFVAQMDRWADRQAVQEALINAEPTYPRGTLAYHPYEYGWLLDEIVFRIDGRSLPDCFAEEIAEPLGLPGLQFGLAGRDIDNLAYAYWLGEEKVIVGGVNVAETFEEQNSVQFFETRNPATCLVSDGASLAAFYEFVLNGGLTPAGERLVSESVLRKYTTRQVYGRDKSTGQLLSVGRGFMTGSFLPSPFGWWRTNSCFGHPGAFSSLGFGDYKTGIAAAIVTNGNRSSIDFARRFLPLVGGLRHSVQ